MSCRVVMVGDNVNGPGGIASVVRTYAEGGLFDDNSVRYLTNYDGAGAQRQIAVMARIFGQLLSLFLNHRPRLVHIHSASRGSFWRAAAIGELHGHSSANTPFIFTAVSFQISTQTSVAQWGVGGSGGR